MVVDGGRLTRLLENCSGKRSSTGGQPIAVTVGRFDGGFYVADDGVGIPEELRDPIFESGFSGGDGTGFGLSIVQQIAEAHG